MIPYILIILIPIVFNLGMRTKKEDYIIGNGCSVDIDKASLGLFFFCFFILLALRNETQGIDLQGYKYVYFLNMKYYSFKQLLQQRIIREPLFQLINKTVLSFTSNFNVLMAVVAFLSVLPMAYAYCKCSKYWFLELVLFLFTPTYQILFSTLRQGLAIGIGVLAYYCMKNKKYINYFFLVFIAFLIHKSSILILTFLPIYNLKLKRKHFPFIIAIAAIMFIFNDKILQLGFAVLGRIGVYTSYLDISDTGEYGNVLLYPVFVVFAFLITDEKKMDRDAIGLRNILVFMLFIQMFAPLNYMVMRLNYYYISLLPIIISTMIEYSSDDNKGIAQIAKLCLCGLFLLVYAKEVYSGCFLGVRYMDNYPYIPLWK